MNKIDRFLLSSILVALCVNIASNFISKLNNNIETYAGYLVVGSVFVWALLVVLKMVYNYFTDGKFAVEAFILNRNNELLVYKHNFHKKFIPPGGRVRNNEFPDIALVNRLNERVGLKDGDYSFNEILHPDFNVTNHNISSVKRLPVPFIIQKEIRKQRLFKKFHYDFIYVLNMSNNNITFPNNIYVPFKFVNMEALNRMVDSNETFPDVADTYQRILDKLNR